MPAFELGFARDSQANGLRSLHLCTITPAILVGDLPVGMRARARVALRVWG